jgi:biopolymer transport protein ExbB/TolQ
MGLLAKLVAILLAIMSIYSIAVMIEKFLAYGKSRKQSIAFLPELIQLLKERQLQPALDATRNYPRAHIAKVVSAGLLEYENQKEGGVSQNFDRVGAIRRATEMSTTLTSAEMKRGLGGLATIGSTAPFVGLFGTVVGVMNAFSGMAETGVGSFGAVSAGIAEALVTTAFGLFVAIPAVWAYNYFTERLERFTIEMNNAGQELIDFFLKKEAA